MPFVETTFQRHQRKAFTLIEIAVVLGIIFLLAALLFPVLLYAKESGRRNTCLNNMKQLSLGMLMYSRDNDGRFPLYEYGVDVGRHYPLAFFWQNALLPYVKVPNLFYCPDYSNPPLEKRHSLMDIDYVINEGRLNYVIASKNYDSTSRSEAELPNASTIWILREYTNENQPKLAQEYLAYCNGRKTLVSTMHSGGSHFSYLDGHVKWLTPTQYGEIDCMNPPPLPYIVD